MTAGSNPSRGDGQTSRKLSRWNLVYQLEFDERSRIVRCAFNSDVTEDDLFNADQALTSFTETTQTEGAIYDFSDVQDFRVSPAAMEKLVTLKSPGLNNKTRVVVAPQPVIFGLCRIFQSLRDSAGDSQISVVRTFPEALEIFGRQPLKFTRVPPS